MEDWEKWEGLSEEEKEKFDSFYYYQQYLKNPENYKKPDYYEEYMEATIDKEIEEGNIKGNISYETDNSSSCVMLDMDLALLPINGHYKLGGIFYNSNQEEEIPIPVGDMSSYSVSFTQHNERKYTINIYDYMETANNVKLAEGGSYETIATNVERTISDNSYIYVVSTPNGAFSVTCPNDGEIGYYDDLVINRLQRAL